MKVLKKLQTFVVAVFALVADKFRSALDNAKGSGELYFANIAEGTHVESITKKSDAAISLRYAVVKIGSDIDHVAVTTANTEIPLGVCTDESDAAEDLVAVELLGAQPKTLKVVASDAITAGAMVVCTAAGKVVTLPVAAGTYYIIGRALKAAGADGDVIEIASCFPTQRVVT